MNWSFSYDQRNSDRHQTTVLADFFLCIIEYLIAVSQFYIL